MAGRNLNLTILCSMETSNSSTENFKQTLNDCLLNSKKEERLTAKQRLAQSTNFDNFTEIDDVFYESNAKPVNPNSHTKKTARSPTLSTKTTIRTEEKSSSIDEVVIEAFVRQQTPSSTETKRRKQVDPEHKSHQQTQKVSKNSTTKDCKKRDHHKCQSSKNSNPESKFEEKSQQHKLKNSNLDPKQVAIENKVKLKDSKSSGKTEKNGYNHQIFSPTAGFIASCTEEELEELNLEHHNLINSSSTSTFYKHQNNKISQSFHQILDLIQEATSENTFSNLEEFLSATEGTFSDNLELDSSDMPRRSSSRSTYLRPRSCSPEGSRYDLTSREKLQLKLKKSKDQQVLLDYEELKLLAKYKFDVASSSSDDLTGSMFLDQSSFGKNKVGFPFLYFLKTSLFLFVNFSHLLLTKN